MANRNVPTNNGAGFDEPSDIYQLVPLSRFDANSFLSEEAPPQSLTQYGRISTESSHGETVEMSLSTFWKAGLGRPNPMTVMQVFIYRSWAILGCRDPRKLLAVGDQHTLPPL